MQNINQVMEYFAAARVFGIRPGLERIKELLRRLDDPQDKIPAVHIAGTNGKGSVSAFISSIAAHDGRVVGWYTSPYLENFNERIRILRGREGFQNFLENARSAEISDAELIRTVTRVRAAAEAMLEAGFESPTEFELITASAFLYFAESNCDLLVLETGMGGRLDASNVIKKPLVSVITALGYDHTDRLGKHLAEIAGEKAGIIKTSAPLVFLDPEIALDKRGEAAQASEVIRQVATAKASPVTEIFASDIEACPLDLESYTQSFRFQGETRPYSIRLLGEYQLYNAALAIAAARHFASPESIYEGLAEARWPGRFEFLAKNPAILIDGAHNLQGVLGLRAELERYFAGRELIFFSGMLADKEHQKMLEQVFSETKYKTRAVFVTAPPVPRAFPAQDLAGEVANFLPNAKIHPYRDFSLESLRKSEDPQIYYCDDYNEVAGDLVDLAQSLDLPLVAFGSLYLIGNSRPILRNSLAASKEKDEQ
ncbi:MAG: folylpolyglutamate synthase/dihydrofolate synthase family protein [Eubacteriales bacterium]|nr:folylpolyglutamate synthase/dihydrofolate synthase family protein [Eubacteriales bacterium]